MSRILAASAQVASLLIATPRRRRLAFLGVSTPGALTAILAPRFSHDPAWLGLGLVILLIALAARRLSEPCFLAREARASAAGLALKDHSHDS